MIATEEISVPHIKPPVSFASNQSGPTPSASGIANNSPTARSARNTGGAAKAWVDDDAPARPADTLKIAPAAINNSA